MLRYEEIILICIAAVRLQSSLRKRRKVNAHHKVVQQAK